MTKEELIKKHLGEFTPQWIVDNCKRLLEEHEESLTLPHVSGSVYETTNCGNDGVAQSCKYCGAVKQRTKH